MSEEHLDELERLVESAGGQVVARILKERASPDPATYVGKGAVEEIGEAARTEKAGLVVFDDELTPGDNRFSAPTYRVIQFVTDVPVRVPPHVMQLAPPGSDLHPDRPAARVELRQVELQPAQARGRSLRALLLPLEQTTGRGTAQAERARSSPDEAGTPGIDGQLVRERILFG